MQQIAATIAATVADTIALFVHRVRWRYSTKSAALSNSRHFWFQWCRFSPSLTPDIQGWFQYYLINCWSILTVWRRYLQPFLVMSYWRRNNVTNKLRWPKPKPRRLSPRRGDNNNSNIGDNDDDDGGGGGGSGSGNDLCLMPLLPVVADDSAETPGHCVRAKNLTPCSTNADCVSVDEACSSLDDTQGQTYCLPTSTDNTDDLEQLLDASAPGQHVAYSKPLATYGTSHRTKPFVALLPRNAMHSADFVVARCPSVCPLHDGILSKRLTSSNFFRRRVARLFFRTKRRIGPYC